MASVPLVARDVPNVRYVLASLADMVPGERVYDRLRPRMDWLGSKLVHVGVLTDAELSDFYREVDVLVLPSTNSTESFGMTQAEAMLAGTPVVATDLPGVREPIRITGMGEVIPPSDEEALAGGIVAVLQDPARYVRPEQEIREWFDPQRTTDSYEELFQGLLRAGRETAAVTTDPGAEHTQGNPRASSNRRW